MLGRPTASARSIPLAIALSPYQAPFAARSRRPAAACPRAPSPSRCRMLSRALDVQLPHALAIKLPRAPVFQSRPLSIYPARASHALDAHLLRALDAQLLHSLDVGGPSRTSAPPPSARLQASDSAFALISLRCRCLSIRVEPRSCKYACPPKSYRNRPSRMGPLRC